MPSIQEFIEYRDVAALTSPLVLNRSRPSQDQYHVFITRGGTQGEVPNLYKVILSRRADLPLNGMSGGIYVARLSGQAEPGRKADLATMSRATRCLALSHIDHHQAHMYMVPLDHLTYVVSMEGWEKVLLPDDYELIKVLAHWRYGCIQEQEKRTLFLCDDENELMSFIREMQL